MLWNMFRYYILGTLVPMAIYILIKDYAHDQKNYYNAFLIESPNSPNYKRESNPMYRLDNINTLVGETTDKDFLGRRGGDFYRVLSINHTEASKPAAIQGDYEKMQKTTSA